jgi:hypothetical protein
MLIQMDSIPKNTFSYSEELKICKSGKILRSVFFFTITILRLIKLKNENMADWETKKTLVFMHSPLNQGWKMLGGGCTHLGE